MVDIGGIGAQMQKLQTKQLQTQSGLSNTGNQTHKQPANTQNASHDKNYITQTRNNDIERLSTKQLQMPAQEGKNLTAILRGAGAFQKLSHFAGKGKSMISKTLNDFNLGAKNSPLFTGKDIDELLVVIKNNHDNKIVLGAVANLLRSALSEQKSKAAKSKIQSIVDELSDTLNDIESEEVDVANTGNKQRDAKRSNGLTSNSSWMKSDPSSDDFRNGLSELTKSLPNDSKALDAITRLVHAVHTLDEAKHFDTSSSVHNLHALFSQLDEGDEMYSKLQQPLAIAEKLSVLSKMSGALVESDEALAFIGKIKDLYAENAMIQSLSSQILQGLTTNDDADQAMFHFILKSLFNGEPHMADLWVNTDEQDDSEEKGSTVTLLMETEFEDVGNFEVELKLVDGNMLVIDVQCPEDYIDEMNIIRELVTDQVHASGYSLPNVTVGVFEEKVTEEDSYGDDFGQRGDFIAKV